MNIKIIGTCLGFSMLTACDQGLESDDVDTHDESFEVEEIAEDVDPWEGLTLDDMAQLEDEDGTDQAEAWDDARATDLTASPDSSRYSWCLYADVWEAEGRQYAKVSNICDWPVKYRMIWKWAADTPCLTLSGRGFTSLSRNRFARLERLEMC